MRLYLGTAILAAQRFEEAEAVFRRDLVWHQNNGWSLFGLMKALEAQGRAKDAAVIQEQWSSVWSDADVALSMPVIL